MYSAESRSCYSRPPSSEETTRSPASLSRVGVHMDVHRSAHINITAPCLCRRSLAVICPPAGAAPLTDQATSWLRRPTCSGYICSRFPSQVAPPSGLSSKAASRHGTSLMRCYGIDDRSPATHARAASPSVGFPAQRLEFRRATPLAAVMGTSSPLVQMYMQTLQ